MCCNAETDLPAVSYVSTVSCRVSTWSPDGRYFASCSSQPSRYRPGQLCHILTLLHFRTGQTYQQAVGHTVDKVVWSSDGKGLLVCHEDLGPREIDDQYTIFRLCA